MLKGKKGLYILLPVVVLVWGMLIYKFVAAFSNDNIPELAQHTVTTAPIKTIVRNSFSISKVQRDPFLGNIYQLPKKKVLKKVKKRMVKEVIQWPNLYYKGNVADKNGSTSVFMLEIDSQVHLLSMGDTANAILLHSKLSDSVIRVKYKGEIKKLKIQNSF